MIKTRIFPESNYKGIWFNGKTIRIALDPSKPITELKYPEFYDIKLTGYCEGECPWCYMDSKKTDSHYENVVEKINDYFGPMSENERPFQVAIGGGEPTSHPDFIEVLKTFKELGIEPNYTTNGMWADFNKGTRSMSGIIEATKEYCGGVAVSCHPHLSHKWARAAKKYINYGIKLNFHIVISDIESIDNFKDIYSVWSDAVDYFVLLPWGNQGRAEHKDIDWEYLIKVLPEKHNQIAFGANFYPYLVGGGHNINVSLYEPESMSKFLDLEDMTIHKSSFNLNKNGR
jgi:MoaA/NifB/PqqE/SkfB family radical SAM enzyme